MNRKYSAFTLVEMLIVMGILIILMAVGITAGRFAINRANDVAHQNAADQIYTAMQAYYTDNRSFPLAADLASAAPYFQTAIEDGGKLNPYMSSGEFTGGTDATFYYYVEPLVQQEVMICVSKGGINDATYRGFYCTGNAFGSAVSGPGSIDSKDVPNSKEDAHTTPGGQGSWTIQENWIADDGKFKAQGA
ncbi:MAG: type II secretion system protein [Candidatus Dojkabacteria bacterium]